MFSLLYYYDDISMTIRLKKTMFVAQKRKTKFLKTHPLLNFIVLSYIHFYLFWFAITIRVTFKTRLFPRISFTATYYCARVYVYDSCHQFSLFEQFVGLQNTSQNIDDRRGDNGERARDRGKEREIRITKKHHHFNLSQMFCSIYF